jgi:hypothetical protein
MANIIALNFRSALIMTRTKATLYFEPHSRDSSKPYIPFDLYGRALTQEEYDNITLDEIRDAICHASAGICIFDIDNDIRFTPEFYGFSIDELKQKLNEAGVVLFRYEEPSLRNEFPLISRGPRKGMPNFKKEPHVYEDLIYGLEFKDEVVAIEGYIEEVDDGTFTVLELVETVE